MLTLALLFVGLSFSAGGGCSPDLASAGACSLTNTGKEIVIDATRDRAGSNGVVRQGAGAPKARREVNLTPRKDFRIEDLDANDRSTWLCDSSPLCRGNYTVELRQRATLADVASFAPGPAAFLDEPGSVGIVGMPVNFTVSAGSHTVSGELFDRPVTVHFDPVEYVFVHGDGTTRASAQGGASWSSLGQPQFTATATSHAYAARGTYHPHGIVRYLAAVDFGDGWEAVDGLLEIPTRGTSVQIVEVRTALVDQTCLENPTGPAC